MLVGWLVCQSVGRLCEKVIITRVQEDQLIYQTNLPTYLQLGMVETQNVMKKKKSEETRIVINHKLLLITNCGEPQVVMKQIFV